jgi:hypothetical protein
MPLGFRALICSFAPMLRLFPIFCFLVMFSACSGDDAQKNALARVGDTYLYREEVRQAIPYGISAKDSMALSREYIEQWVRQRLMLRQAENNLTDEQKDVSAQLEDYRRSLLVYAYERELIRQKLDTIVSDAEIENYYQNNPANFELKTSIIRLRYIKLPIQSPNAEKAGRWFQGKSPEDQNRLEQYCKMYAVNYLLNDNNWLLFQDVLKEIPISDFNLEKFNRNQRYFDIKDKDYRYFVSVSGFMVEESNAPLSFEKENIRNIILNKRKIKLIEKMQQDIFTEAINENHAEILTPNP